MSKKVVVIGGGAERVAITRMLISMAKDVVQHESKQWEPITELDFNFPEIEEFKTAKVSSNEWRGGSRGKGGKTKWPRR